MNIIAKSLTIHSELELTNLTISKDEKDKLIITLKNTINGQLVTFSGDFKEIEQVLGNFLYE